MITAEIISIGDELLIGQTINTNASWLGNELALIGIKVKHVTTVSDDEQEIREAVDRGLKRNRLVLMTGGLGPTKDDITKKVLCSYFNSKLIINQQVKDFVVEFFQKRNRPLLEVNLQQAEVPDNCVVLYNSNGTAPGMWFEQNNSVLIAMPGVPYEMKGIFKESALPRITENFEVGSLYQRTILLQGKGESFLADEMADWENRLRNDGLELAYLPSPGIVKMRISTFKGDDDAEKIEAYIQELYSRNPRNVFGQGEETLSEVVGKLLRDKGFTLGTVESCTGGGVSAAITSISGSSDYFKGSFVTYSNVMKELFALVLPEILVLCGAVSEETVKEMSQGGRKNIGVDWCIATTGVAGPTGGTEQKPVGTVWISIAGPDRTVARKYLFGDNRERNIQMTIFAALNLLRCEILGLND